MLYILSAASRPHPPLSPGRADECCGRRSSNTDTTDHGAHRASSRVLRRRAAQAPATAEEPSHAMNEAIVATDLAKSYKEVRALCGLSLAVPEGSVLGLLGPNGAGKTTAVRILTTLLSPDAGTATVAGINVVADPAEARRNIGVSGQNAAVDENLTGFENLDMVGRLYHLGAKRSRLRARELLEQFDLTEAGDRP